MAALLAGVDSMTRRVGALRASGHFGSGAQQRGLQNDTATRPATSTAACGALQVTQTRSTALACAADNGGIGTMLDIVDALEAPSHLPPAHGINNAGASAPRDIWTPVEAALGAAVGGTAAIAAPLDTSEQVGSDVGKQGSSNRDREQTQPISRAAGTYSRSPDREASDEVPSDVQDALHALNVSRVAEPAVRQDRNRIGGTREAEQCHRCDSVSIEEADTLAALNDCSIAPRSTVSTALAGACAGEAELVQAPDRSSCWAAPVNADARAGWRDRCIFAAPRRIDAASGAVLQSEHVQPACSADGSQHAQASGSGCSAAGDEQRMPILLTAEAHARDEECRDVPDVLQPGTPPQTAQPLCCRAQSPAAQITGLPVQRQIVPSVEAAPESEPMPALDVVPAAPAQAAALRQALGSWAPDGASRSEDRPVQMEELIRQQLPPYMASEAAPANSDRGCAAAIVRQERPPYKPELPPYKPEVPAASTPAACSPSVLTRQTLDGFIPVAPEPSAARARSCNELTSQELPPYRPAEAPPEVSIASKPQVPVQLTRQTLEAYTVAAPPTSIAAPQSALRRDTLTPPVATSARTPAATHQTLPPTTPLPRRPTEFLPPLTVRCAGEMRTTAKIDISPALAQSWSAGSRLRVSRSGSTSGGRPRFARLGWLLRRLSRSGSVLPV